jgi:hypothetical protein
LNTESLHGQRPLGGAAISSSSSAELDRGEARAALAIVWRWTNGPAAPVGIRSRCFAGTSTK